MDQFSLFRPFVCGCSGGVRARGGCDVPKRGRGATFSERALGGSIAQLEAADNCQEEAGTLEHVAERKRVIKDRSRGQTVIRKKILEFVASAVLVLDFEPPVWRCLPVIHGSRSFTAFCRLGQCRMQKHLFALKKQCSTVHSHTLFKK